MHGIKKSRSHPRLYGGLVVADDSANALSLHSDAETTSHKRNKKKENKENHKSLYLNSSSDFSMLSDSDNAYLSSSPNSTLKSDISSSNSKPRQSHKDVIATLDNFLIDITAATEKAKQKEEEKKLKVDEQKAKPPSLPSSPRRKWKSVPSFLTDEEDPEDSQFSRSSFDLRSPFLDVFSDEEQESYGVGSERFVKKRNKNNFSMSSQGSVATDNYGLRQINDLLKYLELKMENDELKMQNDRLKKRVSGPEDALNQPEPHKLEPIPPRAPRHSFAGLTGGKHKGKKLPKPGKLKHGKDKSKMKHRYSALMPFVFTARSDENLKFSSSMNITKTAKPSQLIPPKNYSRDDIEIGKAPPETEMWRQSSVKSPSSKDAEKSFLNFDPSPRMVKSDNECEDVVDSPTEVVEVIKPVWVNPDGVSHGLPPVEIPPAPEMVVTPPSDPPIKKVFPVKNSPTAKANSEHRNYVNTKKMTEWGALQQLFPVPPVETNVQLLHDLEISTNRRKPKKKSFQRFKPHSRSVNKKQKGTSNIFLPPADAQGFASTYLAAHAMSSQLTLALSITELEPLTSKPEVKPSADITNVPISIA